MKRGRQGPYESIARPKRSIGLLTANALVLLVFATACGRGTSKPDTPVATDNDCVVPPAGAMAPQMAASRAKHKPIDFVASAKAAPDTAGDYRRTELSQYNRPEAGHPTDGQTITYVNSQKERILVGIEDLQHACHLSTGLGSRRRDARLRSPLEQGYRAMSYHGWPAVEHDKSLRVWVGDRCEVFVNAGSIANARTVGDALDWRALGNVCAARN